ncbi:MAG: polysaccharide biosynthesis tyrosine autokinase [Candidatus Omnitrophica bacterium]|nr:polysaccharide biosynthesis tyrosine autokinase [Candidatus Omnitrophota bacterium]
MTIHRGEPNQSLVVKDSTVMEYSPRDMAYVELNPPPREGKSFRDYLKVLFRRKKMVFGVFMAVAIAALVALELRTPLYEARVKLLIRAEKLVESPYYRDLDGSLKAEAVLTQSEIVKSNPVLERTVKALTLDERPLNYEKPYASSLKKWVIDLKTQWLQKKMRDDKWRKADRFRAALSDLRDRVKVKPVAGTNLFSISVSDFDPITATVIANTVSRYYIIFDLEQQLAEISTKYGEKHLAVIQLRDDIQRLQSQLREAPNSYVDLMGPASVKILEEAPVPTESVGFPGTLLFLAAAFCGLCLAVTLAFILERFDSTISSAEDVEKYLNLPLLGSIPVRKFGTKLLKKEPLLSTRYTRSFQDLADHIHLIMSQSGTRSVLMTASSAGEGASVVTANVATYLSRDLGHKVLVIDANLRNPSLNRFFRIQDGRGFSDVLCGDVPLEAAVRSVNGSLDLLPTGRYSNNPLILFDTMKIQDLLRRAGELYEIILIDSTNLKDYKDAHAISASVDGVVLVVEAGRARRQVVRATLASLEQKKVNLLGVILNKRVFHVPEIIYGRV